MRKHSELKKLKKMKKLEKKIDKTRKQPLVQDRIIKQAKKLYN